MSIEIGYFGTNLTSAGHFVWELGRNDVYRGRLNLNDFPFNPEGLPYDSGKMLQNGEMRFYQFAGFSILAIQGSCSDKRPGSKSIFWIKRLVQYDQMKQLLLSLPVFNAMVEKMPFELKWID